MVKEPIRLGLRLVRVQALHPAGRDVGRVREAAEGHPAENPPLPQPRDLRGRRPHILLLAILLRQGMVYYSTSHYTGYQILSPNDTFVCMFHQFPT